MRIKRTRLSGSDEVGNPVVLVHIFFIKTGIVQKKGRKGNKGGSSERRSLSSGTGMTFSKVGDDAKKEVGDFGAKEVADRHIVGRDNCEEVFDVVVFCFEEICFGFGAILVNFFERER